ncbi:MAG: 3,4-dihydroxybenzoate decarboxylase [Deltaproteobacteria bacterium HGW-Deltaproteobacteria-21]|nr:MAG: 3,4-dihydroxybenzoate decarboxylase [Deltaproteobacteria bacterium HGW-Deltaproteobacteria-21]
MTGYNNADQITDLRSAVELLGKAPNQLICSEEPVDADAELAGIYRHVGAGVPVMPPTRSGPAMLFKRVKGYDDIRVIAGVLANRERIALLLGCEKGRLPHALLDALKNPIKPVILSGREAACQEIIHREPIDILKLLPAPTNTECDAGPYFSMGLIRAEDLETGESDVTIHRICVQGPDIMTVAFAPGRHIGHFLRKAERMGRNLPVSINIGLDPAVYLSSCFEPPTTPLGYDELAIAGGIRKRPVELVNCLSVNAKAIANSEIVIEGEFQAGERMREDSKTNTGYSMPEFTGYMGVALASAPVLKVRAITHRRHPILQTIVGPGEEHGNLSGIPTEASVLRLLEESMPGRVINVYAHPSGGGKLLVIIQFNKRSPMDEGLQRQAAINALTAFSEVKHVILVDKDVDPFDTNDVLWAMTTRYQGDVSTLFIPGVRSHFLDPSQTPEYSRSIVSKGLTCKTIFDCTVPYNLQDRFKRPLFKEVDWERFSGG